MTSVTARIHNKFIKTIEENKIFPKAVVIILNTDVIKTMHYDNYCISEIFGQLLKNLMVGLHRVILAYKEHLPTRSKRQDHLTVLWSLAPLHINSPDSWNSHRKKFNAYLESVVVLFPKMGILWLKKFWEYNNTQLFFNCHFTAEGLSIYWKSVDSAFRHWDTFISSKNSKKHFASTSLHQNQNISHQRKDNDFISMEYVKFCKKQKKTHERHQGSRRLPQLSKWVVMTPFSSNY